MTLPDAKLTPFWFTRVAANLTDAAQLVAGLALCGTAHAHEGHGMPGLSHWHATDITGFALGAVAAMGLAIWTGRK